MIRQHRCLTPPYNLVCIYIRTSTYMHTYIHAHVRRTHAYIREARCAHRQASSSELVKRMEVDVAGWQSECMRLEKQISDAQRAKASSSGSMASLQQENARLKSEVRCARAVMHVCMYLDVYVDERFRNHSLIEVLCMCMRYGHQGVSLPGARMFRICMYVCVCVCMYVCVYTHIQSAHDLNDEVDWVLKRMERYMHIHAYISTCIRAYIKPVIRMMKETGHEAHRAMIARVL
jgi:hypothetical protein